MTPKIEYGEFAVQTLNNEYIFSPSFNAMMKIGSPSEIVDTFTVLSGSVVSEAISLLAAYSLNGGSNSSWLLKYLKKSTSRKLLSSAMIVMQACCNKDCDELIGQWRVGRNGTTYRMGKMQISDIIVLARELMIHGVIGKVKIRKLQRNEGKNEFTDSFNAIEYITAARAHFGVSRDEAEKLTMSEFLMMIKAKYPEEKGFTKEEYDTAVDDYFERKKRRITQAKANNAR
ncbi:DUF6246 family protein [Providencia stuartii]|uniref:DUF6246 family protein n=1 Tax=Providencia stuartii TaxID=588 RepID=UPI0029D46A2A|nr:DUF6246 family protein [Providencia stuartii]MDX7495325.1 DUF6246 family protein [Providencia stuartii]